MPPPPTPRPPQHFLRLEPHPRRQQPKPGSTPARRLDRVVDLGREHLITPTDPQDRAPCRRPSHQGVGQPALPQPLQIGHRGPAPRQHDEVRMLDVGGLGGGEHIDPWLRRDGVQIGGVGDPRQPDRRDPQRPGSPRQPRPLRESERILRVEPHLVQPRDNSEAPQPGSPGQLVEPGVKHRLVAAELVDEIPRQQRPIRVVDDPPVAEDRRQHPAAIDVADEQRGQSEPPRQPEVDVVTRPQVDLRRRPGPLADDQLVSSRQHGIRLVCRVSQPRPPADVLARLQRAARLTAQDDERAAVGRRLEQHGVVQRGGLDSGGDRLQVLRAPDLRAVGTDHRVVAHVLRLERRHPHALARPRPAQSGDDERLPGVGARACHQESRHARHPRIRAARCLQFAFC